MATYHSCEAAWTALATGASGPYHCIEQAAAELGFAGPTVLYAQRAGSGGISLQDAATLTTYTDSGSPDYAYDGTGGSDELLAESWVAEHDEVGVPQLWDFVNAVPLGTLSGMPSVKRADGLELTSGGGSVGVAGIDLSGCEAVLFEYVHNTGSFWSPQKPTSGDGWIFTFRPISGGRTQPQVVVSGAATSLPIISGLTNGTRWAVLISRTAPGTYDVAAFAMDGTVIGSSLGFSAPDTGPGADVQLGFSVPGNVIYRVRGWTSPQSVAAITAVLDGTTTSGWTVDLRGLVSGAYRAAAPTELPIQTASGTGAPTAEY